MTSDRPLLIGIPARIDDPQGPVPQGSNDLVSETGGEQQQRAAAVYLTAHRLAADMQASFSSHRPHSCKSTP
jgi:hypothetical protein